MLLEDGQLTQLSNNDVHDVAPSIRGDFIMWMTDQEDGHVITIYDRSTGAYDVITHAEPGAAASNPRFILMYDTVTEQGDVVTRGYDPITGDLIPLGALPTDLPSELPESDQTGETRALIQSKTQIGRDENLDRDDTPSGPAPNSDTNATTSKAAATSTHTIVLPGAEATSSATSTPTATPSSTSTPATTTSSTTADIPDVVIPPSTASSTE